MPELVVVIGPIASGKSTVAGLLAARLRAAGRAVAVLDVDDVVDAIGGFDGLTGERFRQAQVVHGQLVGAWLRQGFDVIAHGPFFEPHEHDALLREVPDHVRPRRVLLVATYAAALERVADDPARGMSKHPEFLRATYERVESLLPSMPDSDWTFDTTTRSARSIADELATALAVAPD